MAVQIYTSPSAVSFAGNPILVKLISTLSDKTFLRICVRVTATLTGPASASAEYPLSVPLSHAGEAAVFDLSSCIRSLFSQVHRTAGTGRSGKVTYTFKAWDEYLDGNNALVSTEHSSSVSGGPYSAIPGAYTDAQRSTIAEDTASVLGTMKVLTNKPDGEVIPEDWKLCIPVYTGNGSTVSVTAGNVSVGTVPSHAGETAWRPLSMETLQQGDRTLQLSGTERPVIISVIPPQPFATYFEFINRLGGLESIVCYGRRAFSTGVKASLQTLHQGLSFRPLGRYTRKVSSANDVVTLSTGPLTREWARWFADEFFQAEQVWMYDARINGMTPVALQTDGDIQLYDEQDASLIDIPFSVIRSIGGYRTGNHIY